MTTTLRYSGLVCVGALVCFTATARAQNLVHAKDGSGTYGYRDTPVQPWSGYHVHDPDRPVPPRVRVAAAVERPAPSDAVVLFDGKDLSQFRPTKWKLVDGTIEAAEGDLTSQREFGDCQIHLEWVAPENFEAPWYNRGNSGVDLMSLFEIQIFDSYNEKIYPDGMCGAIYGQTPPLVNAALPPGQWQSMDILFVAPVWRDGRLESPARVTVLHNGVVVQFNETIHGEAVHRGLPKYTQQRSQGPVKLGGHNCPIRFRNIWVRPIERPTTRPAQ